jgi:hypothetical protein
MSVPVQALTHNAIEAIMAGHTKKRMASKTTCRFLITAFGINRQLPGVRNTSLAFVALKMSICPYVVGRAT